MSSSGQMDLLVDSEMSSLSNSPLTNSKSDSSKLAKYEGGNSSSGKSSNLLKRHFDGYQPSSNNQQQTSQSLQSTQNQRQIREPPVKKTKVQNETVLSKNGLS